jgi:hypothetical protein
MPQFRITSNGSEFRIERNFPEKRWFNKRTIDRWFPCDSDMYPPVYEQDGSIIEEDVEYYESYTKTLEALKKWIEGRDFSSHSHPEEWNPVGETISCLNK